VKELGHFVAAHLLVQAVEAAAGVGGEGGFEQPCAQTWAVRKSLWQNYLLITVNISKKKERKRLFI